MLDFNVKIKKLNEKATIPSRGSDYAAGYDLYSCLDYSVIIRPHQTEKIGTGLAMQLPDGYFGAIFARSGIATKQGIRPANCVGVVDCDYRGEVIVALHNDSTETKIVNPNERIAQLVLVPYKTMKFEEVNELNETVRGDGGFGSTGRK